MKLLLIEDETRMAEALRGVLSLERYDVDVRPDGPSGLNALLTGEYDLAVADVALPGLNGLEVVRQAREQGVCIPVLMLTARSGLEDKVAGLDCGADDYMTKPFQMQELLARLRALSRRSAAPADGTLTFGDLTLRPEKCELRCAAGRSVRLSEKECRLLEYLLANQDRILTREQLAVRLWGYDSEAEYNNVEVYLSFTRKKIAFLGSAVEIKAVRGVGYELRRRDV